MRSRFINAKRYLTRLFVVGLGIKRWLLLLCLGAGISGMGVVYVVLVVRRAGLMPTTLYNILTLQFLPVWGRILVPLVFGGSLLLFAASRFSLRIVAPYRQPGDQLIDRLYEHSKRNRGPSIVAIGGGTGLSTLLRGLTPFTNNITAIVTVADDGGSSGRIRQELGMLPPGDIRSNMAALARDEALMSKLLQYRFASQDSNDNNSLHGHSFGNLLLAALAGITGSFDEGLLAAERVLALRGRVVPATLDMVRLSADVRSGVTGKLVRVVGESAIPRATGHIERLQLEPAGVRAFPPAIQAILKADLIVLGPGSLYTSVLPNLLVSDLAAALQRARATRVYVSNLVTQPGETDNYNVAHHVEALKNHLPNGCIDVVLANNNFQQVTYLGRPVDYVRPARLQGERLIMADLTDPDLPVRHDSEKLALALLKYIV